MTLKGIGKDIGILGHENENLVDIDIYVHCRVIMLVLAPICHYAIVSLSFRQPQIFELKVAFEQGSPKMLFICYHITPDIHY